MDRTRSKGEVNLSVVSITMDGREVLGIHAGDYVTESSEAELALQRRKVDTTWPKRAGERILRLMVKNLNIVMKMAMRDTTAL